MCTSRCKTALRVSALRRRTAASCWLSLLVLSVVPVAQAQTFADFDGWRRGFHAAFPLEEDSDGIAPRGGGAPETVLRQDVRSTLFVPETTIRYTLSSIGPVRVEVFDLRGRSMVRLVDEIEAAGPHRVVWNGRDATGRRVAAGIYWYRIESRDQAGTFEDRLSRIGRMVVIR
jgi:hypothetical protein